MRRGLLLIDRGSREREAAEELEIMTEGIRDTGEYEYVDFCFLEVVPPFIEDAMKRCMEKNLDELVIVPYFLYPGKKVKAAVAEVMKYQNSTGTRFHVAKPMLMHETLLEIVIDLITDAAKKSSTVLEPRDTDVLIIGHGSKDINAHLSINYIVDGLRKRYRNVSRCFLEIEQPDIDAGVAECKKNDPKALVIVFYFLHEGAHVKLDVNADLRPALEKYGIKDSYITKHLGADKRMTKLVMERAREVRDAD